MACDPRQKLGAQQNKSEFFRTLGKVGDIEALNSANGEIGQGLRALETISNQLRTGEGPVANIWRDVETSIEAGADAVMSTVGIDPNAARDIGSRFNPGVLNRAQGQAEAIYDRVRQGNFEIRDVPEAIQDFGNLGQLLGGVFTPNANQDSQRPSSQICDPSPWAMDLINLAPKHKFMYVVEFVFTEEYTSLFSDLKFAFMVKRSTRPNVSFEYEDINYYNFRTKVLKKSEYQLMQMTFYDDMIDNVLRFYNRYLQAISPISRSVGEGTSQLFEEVGMSFNRTGPNSSSITAVGDTTKTIIDYINLYHIVHAGRQVDVYRFDNPRLQTMQLDDLDSADNGMGSEVVIEFNYDGLLILPAQDIREFGSKIIDATSVGEYPITLANVPADYASTTSSKDEPTGGLAQLCAENTQRYEEALEREAAALAEVNRLANSGGRGSREWTEAEFALNNATKNVDRWQRQKEKSCGYAQQFGQT